MATIYITTVMHMGGMRLPQIVYRIHCPERAVPLSIGEMRFRERLGREFESRRKKNPRSSVRAFAVFLDVDHSTLAQILRGTRRVPVSRVRAWARRTRLFADNARATIPGLRSVPQPSRRWPNPGPPGRAPSLRRNGRVSSSRAALALRIPPRFGASGERP
jgi:hypothetical protein